MNKILKNFLSGISNLGVAGSPRSYPRFTNTPFSDDREKMRADSRAIKLTLANNARMQRHGAKAIGRASGI